MIEQKWFRYAEAWSLPSDRRKQALEELVTEDVTYTDPNVSLRGRANLSQNMQEFQKDVPGGHFEITGVKVHHGQSLASWNLRDSANEVVMEGTSSARLDEGAVFASFTGFF